MIHVEDLTKYYNDFCAVDRINLDIENGEVLGLLGPNGAGKTTTLRMLTGYLRPSTGRIHVKDMTMKEDATGIKKLIGYLPESAPLYYGMLVYDYLDYVAGIRGIRRGQKAARIRRLSKLCGLADIMHMNISELSKGLKQRVGLAHAMMNDPEILVLDEPTSGLDPNQIVEIRDIIRQIGREKTVIFSTHILSEAEATCDRVVIINHGKIVADGSMEDLKQAAGKTRHIYLLLDNADFNSVERRLQALEGVEDVVSIEDTAGDLLSVRIACSPSSDLRPEIYRAIRETEWILMELRQETRTLESTFRELTKETVRE